MNTVQRMSTNNVRAEEIFHLGSMLHASDLIPDVLKEALELDVDKILEAIGIEHDDDESDLEDIPETIRESRKNGWLVRFSTPVPRFFVAEGKVKHALSWAHYANSWFYGEDFEQLCQEAIKWADDFIADREARWKKTGK